MVGNILDSRCGVGNGLIVDVVLTMGLIKDVLALLMVIEQPEHNLTTTEMAITTYKPTESCSLITGQPPWLPAMMIGGQQATQPACWTPGTIQ